MSADTKARNGTRSLPNFEASICVLKFIYISDEIQRITCSARTIIWDVRKTNSCIQEAIQSKKATNTLSFLYFCLIYYLTVGSKICEDILNLKHRTLNPFL